MPPWPMSSPETMKNGMASSGKLSIPFASFIAISAGVVTCGQHSKKCGHGDAHGDRHIEGEQHEKPKHENGDDGLHHGISDRLRSERRSPTLWIKMKQPDNGTARWATTRGMPSAGVI